MPEPHIDGLAGHRSVGVRGRQNEVVRRRDPELVRLRFVGTGGRR
ncbi:hypothetical protein [Streptomyces sp. NPDC047985]